MTCEAYVTFAQFLESHTLVEALTCFLQKAPVDPATAGRSLWMIIALPLLGALINGVFGRALGRANVGLIACTAMAGAFVLSLLTFWVVVDPSSAAPNAFFPGGTRYAIGADYGTWFQVGSFRVELGLLADHLSAAMLLVITGVGFLIHVYSVGYMEHDDGYWRYFAYLNLFVAMMLTLVLGKSLPLTFIGWEGVGLCSYLLIGFWYTDAQKAWAGRKAFVTNRIGDFGFLLAMFLLVLVSDAYREQAQLASFGIGVDLAGPLSFPALEVLASGFGPGRLALSTVIAAGPLAGVTFQEAMTAIVLLFLLAAAGKSAQLPLYVWLPDAMAGPTPVSALIHAATMVTAGVYLFCRLSYLVVLSPAAMATIAIVGAATALFAALIAFAQDDIKKVLAYSTVSQLGFMFLGVGMGVFWAAFLHVVTHAFFKACLFLGAGSVMHGNGDETDIKRLGGLRREMPWTWATFGVSTLAITGIVPLSGFFSKDAILHGAHSTTLAGYPWVTSLVWIMGLCAAACTAFYMTRLYLLTFEGERSPDAKLKHAHESGFAMVMPLVVLATLAVVYLFAGLPMMADHQTPFETFLAPVFSTARRLSGSLGSFTVHHGEGLPIGAWVMAWFIAVAAAGLALVFYRSVVPSWAGRPVPAVAKAIRRVAQNKFYVDELYDLVIIRPVKFASLLLFKAVDTLLIDTVAVRGTAWMTSRIGGALRYLQTGDLQSYAAMMAIAMAGGLAYVLLRAGQ